MKAIVRTLDGGYYHSLVFGLFKDEKAIGGFSQLHSKSNREIYIVLNKEKTKLITLPLYDSLAYFERRIIVTDRSQENWLFDDDGYGTVDFLPINNILDLIKSELVSQDLLIKCVEQDKQAHFTTSFLLETENDIKNFESVSDYLIDAFIAEVSYTEGILSALFSNVKGCDILINFLNPSEFRFFGNDYYWNSGVVFKQNGNIFLVDEGFDEDSEVSSTQACFSGQVVNYEVIPRPLNVNKTRSNYNNGLSFGFDETLRLVSVIFNEYGNDYYYFCNDKSVQIGDRVVVPVGEKLAEKIATVSNIIYAKPSEISYPISQIKTVIRKYTTFNKEKVKNILRSFGKEAHSLNLKYNKKDVDENQSYDYIETPIGKFWLELNEVPIPMTVQFLYNPSDNHEVDCAVQLIPKNYLCHSFKKLKICSDNDIDSARFIDYLSDEYVCGSRWQYENFDIGITATVSPNDDEIDFDYGSRIPYYIKINKSYLDYYGFNLAWKKFLSDEDLALFFRIT